jgi:hypothetical protein
MNEKQLRDYLFLYHYKPSAVQEAIKPHTDYQDYRQNWSPDSEDIVVTFGAKSGQKVPLLDTILFRLRACANQERDYDWYYIHKSEVFRFNLHRSLSENMPNSYLICLHAEDNNPIHPDDMVLTYCNRWLPKNQCVTLSPQHYGDDPDNADERPIYQYRGDVRTTYDDQIICNSHAVLCESDHNWYHEDEAGSILQYNDCRDYYVHPDDDNVRWCIDIDQYTLVDDCYYCHLDGEFYYYEGNLPNRDHTQTIQDYHCGVEPYYHCLPLDQTIPLSKYTIGFEVEKDCLDNGDQEAGSLIEQQPLFSHWETDSSCGIEGITNVYSLDNYEKFFDDACDSKYIDLNTNNRCGGHINFAHRENKMQYWHIRPWLGLIFSMWKKRLTNQYASCNKKLNPYRGTDHHYGALVEKGRLRSNTRFELRLPNRVKDRACILRRFKLMQALAECIEHYMNEDFTWMTASYDDKIQGIPNWMDTTDEDAKSWCIKIEQLLSNISAPTQARTRFFVEKAKDMLFGGYAEPNHVRVLAYAYAFQSYIDEEQPSHSVTQLTNSYIN